MISGRSIISSKQGQTGTVLRPGNVRAAKPGVDRAVGGSGAWTGSSPCPGSSINAEPAYPASRNSYKVPSLWYDHFLAIRGDHDLQLAVLVGEHFLHAADLIVILRAPILLFWAIDSPLEGLSRCQISESRW